MEVVVIDSEAYKEIINTISLQRKLFLDTVTELKEAKNERWISADEVSEIVGFGNDWVYDRKDYFGYFKEGKDLRFWKPNVLKYMADRATNPKINKAILKLKRA